jgi:hypothetical protein
MSDFGTHKNRATEPGSERSRFDRRRDGPDGVLAVPTHELKVPKVLVQSLLGQVEHIEAGLFKVGETEKPETLHQENMILEVGSVPFSPWELASPLYRPASLPVFRARLPPT